MTRSLGDSSMKEFVVGSPYTTETTLMPEDDFLIIACDGVSGNGGVWIGESSLSDGLAELTWGGPASAALGRLPRSRGGRFDQGCSGPSRGQQGLVGPRVEVSERTRPTAIQLLTELGLRSET